MYCIIVSTGQESGDRTTSALPLRRHKNQLGSKLQSKMLICLRVHTNLLNHNFAEESDDQMGLNYESNWSRNLVTVVLCTFKIGLLYTLNGSPQTVIYSVVIICFRKINKNIIQPFA